MLKKIEQILCEAPGMKAKDIAKELQRDKHDVNSFLYAHKDYFQVDHTFCWSLKNTELRIQLTPHSWIDCNAFETALAEVASPLDSQETSIVFVIPKGCKLLLEAIARLMALSNQLAYNNKKVTLDFSQQFSTLSYVNRLGFFDHLDKKINVLPSRPETSGAITYKHNSSTLFEFAAIDHLNPDESIPKRLKTVFVSVAGDKYAQAAFTVLSELFGNVRDHSESLIPGFIGLQFYENFSPPHIQTVISDSGKGILGTLKPILAEKYPEIFQRIKDSEIEFDIELLKWVFTEGRISQSDDEGRGLGLKSSSNAASKFNGTISVRQENCEVRFAYFNGSLKDFKFETNLTRIYGTHICFDFKLDQLSSF
jgi:hypothetical protein